jgi:hypothetical protein
MLGYVVIIDFQTVLFYRASIVTIFALQIYNFVAIFAFSLITVTFRAILTPAANNKQLNKKINVPDQSVT